MSFAVKKVEQEDIKQLAAIASEVWHEYFPCILSEGQIDYMVEKFQSEHALRDQVENQGYEYYFLVDSGTVIGYTGIKPELGKLFLSKLYILKQYRKQGFASEAFAFLRQYCAERGLKSIWLTVNRHNADTIAVYKKKGFSVVREQEADIGGGYVMDDYVMELTL